MNEFGLFPYSTSVARWIQLFVLIIYSTPCTAFLTSKFAGSRRSPTQLSVVEEEGVANLATNGDIYPDDETQATASSKCPLLQIVPKVPVLGSFFAPLTGIPPLDGRFPHRFNVEMNKAYGDFYCMTIPTLGKDIQPELYVITDPNEMRKIVQSQPSDDELNPKYQHPVGIVEQQWPFSDYLKRYNATTANIFSRGPQWWQARQAVQNKLTVPPGEAIEDGAVDASRRIMETTTNSSRDEAVQNSWIPLPDDFSKQLNRAAFDMFEQVLFHGTLDFNSIQVESNELFESTLSGMLQAQTLRRSPWQNLAQKFGLRTSSMKQCYENLDKVLRILKRRVGEARKSPVASSGDCYVARNFNSGIHDEELPFTCLALLMGAIDTTAGKIGWNILQLAFHPEVQQELYDEIHRLSGPDRINPIVMDRKQTPMLHGVIRETHRVTPAVTVNLIKDALCPVTIHGQEFPPQTAFMFDSTTPQLGLIEESSSKNGDDPAWEYNPRRWFPEAVQARKNAGSAALLDHAYFAQPFGQGPRRCPGATVALAEVHAFVAQFVLDWEVSLEPRTLEYRNVPSLMNTGPIPDFPLEMRIRKRTKAQD